MLSTTVQIITALVGIANGATQEWTVDLNAKTEPFYYYWNKCVGSGHADLMVRDDWRDYMKNGHDSIGFSMVRGHGIFMDDVGSYNGDNDYSFINIDKIYKYLTSINMKPYVEISFMPDLLKSGDTTVCHYKGNVDPPTDYNKWYNFIKAFAQNLVDVFGIDQVSNWYFEVWNEPNTGFWGGNPKYNTYLQLYNSTARAIKSVSEKLMVGGPVVNHPDTTWINNFLTDTLNDKIPIDFIVYHSYPKVQSTLQSFKDGIDSGVNVVDTFNNKNKLNLPAFISEYASTCCAPKQEYDDSYSASFLIYMAQFMQSSFPKQGDSTLKWMSYWAISDVFEENGFQSTEFSGYYGLQTIRGIAKPAFRAMELLEKYGGNVSYSSKTNVKNGTVMVYTLNNGEKNRFGVFVSNFNSLNLPINAESVDIYISNNGGSIKSINGYRIDNNNTNPLAEWKSMGSPKYETEAQFNKINESSQIIAANVGYQKVNASTIKVSLNLDKWSVAVLDVQY